MAKITKSKEEELKHLTWKYFWRYKLIELIIIGTIVLLIWISYINRVPIEKWLANSHPLLMSILTWIFVALVIAAIVFFLILSNWNKAEEKAKAELGIEEELPELPEQMKGGIKNDNKNR